MNIEQFISVLDRAGLEFQADDILDAIWLAGLGRTLTLHAHVPATPLREPGLPEPAPPPAAEPEEEGPDGSGADKTDAEVTAPAVRDTAPVYARGSPSGADRTVKASPVTVPAARALANRLGLMRSLRPLRQRWPFGRDQELDEEQTVEATAKLRNARFESIYPVFRPRLEPWFDVDIVREDDAAIELWDEAIRDFAQMLRDTGAFRQVRSWRLRLPSGRASQPVLETPAGGRFPSGTLAGRGTRRLIFFATHGSSWHWRDGSYVRVLEPWLHDCSVVLVHLMPRERWAHTRLGDPHGLCAAEQPGSSASSLKLAPFWWMISFDPRRKALLPLPVTSFNASAMSEWAHMQMARGRHSAGFLIDPRTPTVQRAPPDPSAARDPERAIAHLRETSPEAFRLAVYLCTSAFTIPVARLIQHAVFGEAADQSHLAELFLSGLVVAKSANADGDEASVHYFDIRPQAREVLIRSLRERDAEHIARELLKRVSDYIAEISESPFALEGLVPDENGKYDLPGWAQPFAEVALALLGVSPRRENALDLFRNFTSAHPAEAGQVARLVGRENPLRPDAVAARTWDALREADLIRQTADGEWALLPGIAEQFKRLDEDYPLHGIAILWIDDQPRNNRALAKQLQSLGAAIDFASSTVRAMSMLASGRYDILISDMARGREARAGLGLLRAVKRAGLDLPVIIYAGPPDDDEVLAAGAFGYANKPGELLELVVAAARLAPATVSSAAEVFSPAHRKRLQHAMSLASLDRAEELLRDLPNNARAIALAALAASPSADAGFAVLLDFIEALTECIVAQVIQRQGEQLKVVADRFATAPGFEIDNERGIIGLAVRTGQTTIVNDVTEDSRYIVVEPRTRSEVALPIFDQREPSFVTGAVNIEFNTVNALSARQVKWLEEFVAPLSSRIPTRHPRALLYLPELEEDFESEDKAFAERVTSDLGKAGIPVEIVNSMQQLNIHDAVLLPIRTTRPSRTYLLYSFAQDLRGFENVVPFLMPGGSARDLVSGWREVVDLRSDYQRGLRSLTETLHRFTRMAGAVEAPVTSARHKDRAVLRLSLRQHGGFFSIVAQLDVISPDRVTRTAPESAGELRSSVLETSSALLQKALRPAGKRTADTMREAIVAAGKKLFSQIFMSGRAMDLYGMAYGIAGGAISIRIDFPSSALNVPWEILHDPLGESERPLCLDHDVSRLVTGDDAEPFSSRRMMGPAPGRPLRVLSLVSSPQTMEQIQDKLDFEAEQAQLSVAAKSEGIELRFTSTGTLRELNRHMRSGRWDVFHFIGYSQIGAGQREEYLIFEGDGGKPHPVSASVLREVLTESTGPQLAVLMSTPLNASRVLPPFTIAPALVKSGLAAVVAMQIPLRGGDAGVFNRELYARLADGSTVADAVRFARRRLYEEYHYTQWIAPVLYQSLLAPG